MRRPDRASILSRIKDTLGSQSQPGKLSQTQVFCIEDGEPIPPESWHPERYRHGHHSNQRAFLFDPVMMWKIQEDDGELRHFSAGTVLWRPEGGEKRYCLMRRRRYPAGYYTIPAGHIEMGESPVEAALREAYEEAGLGIVSVESITPGHLAEEGRELNEECRRGADYHVWHLFLCQCVGEPRLSEEGDVIGWFTEEEILQELRLNRPTGVFFGELFGEQPRHVRER